MTRRDPIVEEVRRHREAIAREHGNDLDAIIAAFQRQDASDSRLTVSLRRNGSSSGFSRNREQLDGPTSDY